MRRRRAPIPGFRSVRAENTIRTRQCADETEVPILNLSSGGDRRMIAAKCDNHVSNNLAGDCDRRSPERRGRISAAWRCEQEKP